MDIALNLAIGIGLSATCGFRIFVPLLVLSVASLTGYIHLSPSFDWIGSYPALITFGVATVAEILGYFFPYVDNLLTAISAPAAVIAGVIVTAAMVSDMSPVFQWSLAIIAGGGAATTTSLISNVAHHSSTATTGGIANPVVSAVETVIAAIMAVFAVVAPIIGIILLIAVIIVGYKAAKAIKNRFSKSESQGQAAT